MKCYSEDGHVFQNEELECLWSPFPNRPCVRHYFEGDSVPKTHSDFVYGEAIIEDICERAMDDAAEDLAEDYVLRLEADSSLAELIEKAVTDVLNEYAEDPGFYDVANVREVWEWIL